ncbi:Eukaryotic translation initiation factor 5B like protein [Verticillium longisporum]|nr:Eukaryotic translation initiation factor 5B like protein [Verticillium longisporum]
MISDEGNVVIPSRAQMSRQDPVVTSIERDHKQIPVCKKGQPSVAVKIEMGGHQPTYGRQLEEPDALYSLISRKSIDTLKEFYRKDVSNDEWQLIIKLKPLFDIH